MANSDAVYNYVLNLIMNRQLKPGEKIAEEKIAQDFGTSRTPVREALRKLESDGLIEIFPKRFVRVKVIEEKEIQDLGVLRIALDQIAIKLSLLQGSKKDFLDLKDIAEKCYEAYKNNDKLLQHELDNSFHQKLIEISGNREIARINQEVSLKVKYLLLYRDSVIGDESFHLRQHFDICDALLNQDEKKAASTAAAHLAVFYNIENLYPKDFFI